jgi:hypothetical protein
MDFYVLCTLFNIMCAYLRIKSYSYGTKRHTLLNDIESLKSEQNPLRPFRNLPRPVGFTKGECSSALLFHSYWETPLCDARILSIGHVRIHSTFLLKSIMPYRSAELCFALRFFLRHSFLKILTQASGQSQDMSIWMILRLIRCSLISRFPGI